MSSFLNVIFSMSLSVVNTSLNTTPLSDVPASVTQAATTPYYNPAFQVGTSSTTIPVPPPNTTAQGFYIRNLDSTNPLTLTFTPVGGSATSIVVPAGALFIYFNPEAKTGGGIGSISATASTATVNAELFVSY